MGGMYLGGRSPGFSNDHGSNIVAEIELIGSTPDEKGQQIRNVEVFRARGQDEVDVLGAHQQAATSLSALQQPPVPEGTSAPRWGRSAMRFATAWRLPSKYATEPEAKRWVCQKL